MDSRTFAALGVTLVTACHPTAPGAPSPEISSGVVADRTGTFSFEPGGVLRLALDRPCRVHRPHAVADCTRAELAAIRVVARTGWGLDIPGVWSDVAHVSFTPNWANAQLDPLDDDARMVAAAPWKIWRATWEPSAEDAERMLKPIGDATDTQTELVPGGAPPRLVISPPELRGGALQSGETNRLTLRVANRGPGTAYRVVVRLRSGILALHNRQLSFGRIEPGAEKVRALDAAVPLSEAGPDAMLVFIPLEGNGAAPDPFSHRIAVLPSARDPKLTLKCVIDGHNVAQPDVDAGEPLTLRCAVQRGAAVDAEVQLEASIAGGAATRSDKQPIAKKGTLFKLPVTVPRDLPINAPVEISVVARDARSARTVKTQLSAVVRKPRLCNLGRLTNEEYHAKLEKLRAAVTTGGLTQAQFDRYDVELLLCLK